SLSLGRQIVQRLGGVLRHDGRACQLDACIDGPLSFCLPPGDALADVAGVAPWDPAAPPRSQLRAGGVLHAAGEQGTMALFFAADRRPGVEEVIGWLAHAWRQTEVCRLRLVESRADAHAGARA